MLILLVNSNLNALLFYDCFIFLCQFFNSVGSGEVLKIAADDVTTISVMSPNAPNEDFETLMSDPISGDLYLLRKNR